MFLTRYRSFLARCRSLQVVLGRLLLVVGCVVGRFRSFLARCRSLQVFVGRFLLVAGRCRSLQVVSGRFRLFLVLVSTVRVRRFQRKRFQFHVEEQIKCYNSSHFLCNKLHLLRFCFYHAREFYSYQFESQVQIQIHLV